MTQVNLEDLDFEKGDGLIPVVVQDLKTREVLTLAYTNKEALELTMETGFAHFYRRSYARVMKKGLTSGNVQNVLEVLVDCDLDAVLYLVESIGPACHKNKPSCFHFKI